MRTTLRRLVCVSTLWCIAATAAMAQTAAKKDGDWGDWSIWTGGTVPGAGDSVMIGSTYPGDAAPNASVTLSSDQSAAYVYLGYGAGNNGTLSLGTSNLTVGGHMYVGFGSGASGTLDLGDGNLNVAGQLYLGYSGASGTVTRGTGSLSAGSLIVDSGNTFAFGAHDAVWNLNVNNNSRATTAATGNVAGNVGIAGGSKLTLGADMSLAGSFTADDGTAMTLDMGGHALSASGIQWGWYNGGPLTIQNRGALNASYLTVGGQTFDFTAADSVYSYNLRSGVSMTAATGNITAQVSLYGGSTLTLGADMTLSGGFTADDGTAMTLDMGGHSLSASGIQWGWYNGGPLTIQNRGAINANYLYVGSPTFDFTAADSVYSYNLRSGVSTTTATGNITGQVNLYNGSTLTLGADMTLSGGFTADDGTAMTLDMGGHSLSASGIQWGWYNGGPLTIQNRGALNASYLNVGGQTFDFTAADSVYSYNLRSGASTTAAASNITGQVNLYNGSTLTLGADMSLTSGFTADDGTAMTLDMGGHSLSASSIQWGMYNGGPLTIQNRGAINANYMYVGGQTFDFTAADSTYSYYLRSGVSTTAATGNITGQVNLNNGSKLILGADMALSGGFTADDGSAMTLDMGGHSLSAPGIDFGWYSGGPLTIQNRGAINATYLSVGGQTFDFTAADSVYSYNLRSGASTTAAASNITGQVNLYNGSTLTLGADMTLAGNFTADDGTAMTLDMGGHSLSASSLQWGMYNGGPLTIQNRGAINANYMYVGGQTFDFTAPDSVYSYYLRSGTSTTAATGNITGQVNLYNGSKLTFGADMTLSGGFTADDGTAMTLDMGGHALSAPGIDFGWYSGGPLTIQNRGAINATYLSVGGQTFDFTAADSVYSYNLRSGASTTAAASNITGQVNLYNGSTLTLGADMSLSGGFTADDGTAMTLDMGGHSLSASSIQWGMYNGGPLTIQNRGAINANYMYVGGQSFDFIAADSVYSYYLRNGASTTAATGNVTGGVTIYGGSKLTLGADMALSGGFTADDGTAMTLDMGGHSLSAPGIDFGWYSGGPLTIQNRGAINATYLSVGGQSFDFTAADSTYSYNLRSGASTTAAASNITGQVNLYNGSRLTLGADLSLAGNLMAYDNSVVDAVRHSIAANGIYLGYGGSAPTSLVNGGTVHANELHLQVGSTATFHADGTIQNAISLYHGSVLTFAQSKGDSTGLTFNGTWPGALSINDTSKLSLDFGDNDRPSWIFRWQDPYGGTWEGTLAALIGDGKIAVTAPHGYQVYDLGGYTYLGCSVPAPGTLVGLLQLGGIAAAVIVWRRRRRA